MATKKVNYALVMPIEATAIDPSAAPVDAETRAEIGAKLLSVTERVSVPRDLQAETVEAAQAKLAKQVAKKVKTTKAKIAKEMANPWAGMEGAADDGEDE